MLWMKNVEDIWEWSDVQIFSGKKRSFEHILLKSTEVET